MADVEILASQVEAAPLAYAIPGGQEILLKVLAASFDGSAAAGPWQPAVQIVGPSGQVLRTFPVSTPLAAGASADVTWFPKVGGDQGPFTPSFQGVLQLGTSLVGDVGLAFAVSDGTPQASGQQTGAVSLSSTYTVAANAPLIVQANNFGTTPISVQVGESTIQAIGATTREVFAGGIAVLAPGVNTILPINQHVAGSVVIDKTDPLAPIITAAGTYAVTVGIVWLGF